MTPAEKIKKAHIERYDHGGGRMWFEDEKGSRHLIADFYGDGGEMREHILGLMGRTLGTKFTGPAGYSSATCEHCGSKFLDHSADDLSCPIGTALRATAETAGETIFNKDITIIGSAAETRTEWACGSSKHLDMVTGNTGPTCRICGEPRATENRGGVK